MDMKLEAIVVPVSDVDRARHFYRALGFRLDRDEVVDVGCRVVELTPPGSLCSILLGTNLSSAQPGSTCCALRVPDLEAAFDELRSRGAELGQRGLGVGFSDPDGNEWLLVGR